MIMVLVKDEAVNSNVVLETTKIPIIVDKYGGLPKVAAGKFIEFFP